MAKNENYTCGLVMPISPIDGCSMEHWAEVKNIITEALTTEDSPKFDVKLVSDADDVGVIQKRIVQNLYSSDIVVCDVSGKNPNVMFELGMRLAFDKPTIIIKDDKTDYSFDTGVIEHVPYRRDLRFSNITAFKQKLREKALATLQESRKNPEHSTFLKNFGTFHTTSLKESEISSDALLIEMIQELQKDVSLIRSNSRNSHYKERNKDIFVNHLRLLVRNIIRNEELFTSPMDILERPDLIKSIERECDAPRYFESKREFEELLYEELNKMSLK